MPLLLFLLFFYRLAHSWIFLFLISVSHLFLYLRLWRTWAAEQNDKAHTATLKKHLHSRVNSRKDRNTPMLYKVAQRKDAFVVMFWVERMGLLIGIFILLILSRIGSWRVYNLSLLYCIPLILIGMGLIKWCKSLQIMDLWKLKSYYRALTTGGSHTFPWKSIWRWKFFLEWLILLGQPRGKILTLDNLRRNIYIVNRCCMCKNIWESVGHLLLFCSYACNLWTFVFSLFGISWVMPKQVVDLLVCWNRGVGGRCWGSSYLGSNSTMHHVDYFART